MNSKNHPFRSLNLFSSSITDRNSINSIGVKTVCRMFEGCVVKYQCGVEPTLRDEVYCTNFISIIDFSQLHYTFFNISLATFGSNVMSSKKKSSSSPKAIYDIYMYSI